MTNDKSHVPLNRKDLIDLVSETISDTIDLGTATRDYAVAVVDVLQRKGLLIQSTNNK